MWRMEFGVDLKCFETPVMLPEPVMYSIFLTQESDLDKSNSLSCDLPDICRASRLYSGWIRDLRVSRGIAQEMLGTVGDPSS
jgi:hypothetical protein